MPDDFDPTEEEWEGGPLEEAPRDEPAPEMPEPEDLAAQLADLETNEGFDEPEIADEGIPPFEQPLEEALKTLEADEPFEQPAPQAAAAPESISDPTFPDVGELPEDDALVPPSSLEEFYAAGGQASGGNVSLPGFPPPSQDGPLDNLRQYLDSGMSLARTQNDFLIDHSAQLDMLTESLERSRL